MVCLKCNSLNIVNYEIMKNTVSVKEITTIVAIPRAS